jgi:hypothetical protein
MTTLFVCNKGDETFSDSFNGQSYVFSKDKEVELPEIAAKHILVMAMTIKNRTL